ncbi:MAG: aminopeptidase P family protein [bacterium]|nr:aminopeptidase P family protein [bacterium]
MDSATYKARRKVLRKTVTDGVMLFLGNNDSSRNYRDNIYPFRQDSNFTYLTGINKPGMALMIFPDGKEMLFGDPGHPDDLIWSGPSKSLEELAEGAEIAQFESIDKLAELVEVTVEHKVKVHFLPSYRPGRKSKLVELLGSAEPSKDLIKAIIALREMKSDEEIAEMEQAIAVSALMYQAAFNVTKTDLTEARIRGMIEGIAMMENLQMSFPPIVTTHGEVLHNITFENTLEDGQLLLIDSGVESKQGYCSDITRTIPVSGVFSIKQKDIYNTVLRSQEAAINAILPGATNKDVHLAAATAIVDGLKDVGLMTGDTQEAVAAGAHALFYPHGIGHMIGLDVHDMEDLGDAVGYAEGTSRSDQFGLAFLRLAKELKPGFTITIEPGVYFIPELIDRWKAEKMHSSFINYEAAEKYKDFGGIRIEDDVLVTAEGSRVLGPPIPKTTDDIEVLMG